jgi:hypothetical protein
MGDEPVRRRFERDGGQRAIEVGFVEADQPSAGGGGVLAEPAEREFIGDGEQDERVRRDVPVADKLGEGEREFEGGVNGLTCLRPRRKVDPGDDVEAALAVRHEHQCTRAVNVVCRWAARRARWRCITMMP